MINNECIDKNRGFDIIISYKYKFIYCLIQKNGSSSIMYSLSKNDYNDNHLRTERLWHQEGIKIYKEKHFFSFKNTKDLQSFIKNYPDYRKFIVISDPVRRVISYLNFFIILYPFMKNKIINNIKTLLIIQNYINEHYHNIKNEYVEYHSLPQHVFYKFFKEAIGDELEVVKLENLKTYMKDEFDFDLYIINENKNKFISYSDILNEK